MTSSISLEQRTHTHPAHCCPPISSPLLSARNANPGLPQANALQIEAASLAFLPLQWGSLLAALVDVNTRASRAYAREMYEAQLPLYRAAANETLLDWSLVRLMAHE